MPGVSVTCSNLVKRYGKNVALNVPDLRVAPGECVGLVGNNGAGKTTLLRLVLDLIRPSTGAVRIGSALVGSDSSWKRQAGAFLDSGFLVDYLHPMEYLRLVGGAYGMDAAQVDGRATRFERFLGPALTDGALLRDLSTGNANKVGIVGAFLPSPALVLLDEPFANLDPGARISLEALIRDECAEQGATLLVSSHDLDHVVDICSRVLVLAEGQIVLDTPSTPDTLSELRAFFAGGGVRVEV